MSQPKKVTVRELVDLLSGFDPDTLVVLPRDEGDAAQMDGPQPPFLAEVSYTSGGFNAVSDPKCAQERVLVLSSYEDPLGIE